MWSALPCRPAGRPPLYTMVLAAAATRGQRSAHSLATGPVIAEPGQRRGGQRAEGVRGSEQWAALTGTSWQLTWSRPTAYCPPHTCTGAPALSSAALCPALHPTALTLHLALGVDNHARVVLKVDVGAVLPPERLALPHHNRGHDCGAGGGGAEGAVEAGEVRGSGVFARAAYGWGFLKWRPTHGAEFQLAWADMTVDRDRVLMEPLPPWPGCCDAGCWQVHVSPAGAAAPAA